MLIIPDSTYLRQTRKPFLYRLKIWLTVLSHILTLCYLKTLYIQFLFYRLLFFNSNPTHLPLKWNSLSRACFKAPITDYQNDLENVIYYWKDEARLSHSSRLSYKFKRPGFATDFCHQLTKIYFNNHYTASFFSSVKLFCCYLCWWRTSTLAIRTSSEWAAKFLIRVYI